jgi:hypothetical protein
MRDARDERRGREQNLKHSPANDHRMTPETRRFSNTASTRNDPNFDIA